MSIDFSKKTRHPFSLGSAAANLHSSYNSGTKSDKMRPIMRPAANRADNNSLFFSFYGKQICRFFAEFCFLAKLYSQIGVANDLDVAIPILVASPIFADCARISMVPMGNVGQRGTI